VASCGRARGFRAPGSPLPAAGLAPLERGAAAARWSPPAAPDAPRGNAGDPPWGPPQPARGLSARRLFLREKVR